MVGACRQIALLLCLIARASAVREAEDLLAATGTGAAVLHPGSGAVRDWSWPLPCLEARDEVLVRADAHWLAIITAGI